MKGKIIVIEGLDGAGCGTQADILRKKLEEKNDVLFLRYPDYSDPIGAMIHEFLHEKVSLSKEVLFALFALNQLKDRERIETALKNSRIVLIDRYFTSNIAYQCAKKFDVKNALKFAEIFRIPKPDIVFFLEVSPETGIKRKLKEKGDLDINEKNKEFLSIVRASYHNLIKNKVFAKKWIVIDSEKSIENVAEKIWKAVRKEIKF